MDEASIEYAVGGPHPRLRPFVTEYIGYRLAGFEPGVHVGLPSGSLTFIVAFDDPLDLTTEFGSTNRDIFWGVLCGLHTKPAFVWHQGRQHGVQLAITPRGAATLFGIPACELASMTVHLGEVAPSIAAEMIERLSTAASWPARWAVLDEIFLRTLRSDVEMPAELERAWSILSRTHGAVTVADLANEVGWSRRHFAQKFRLSYGLSPKVMARVLRFERAQQLLRLPTQPSLSSVAHVCGYADQAHMTRDWNEFAGSSPTDWMTDEMIPFVQDLDDLMMSS